MKKLIAIVVALVTIATTSCSQSSVTANKFYLLNDSYFLNKAGTSFLTALSRSTSFSEVVYNWDYINQINFRTNSAYYLRLTVPSSLDLSFTLTLPDTLPATANSVLGFGLTGAASWIPTAYIGTSAFSSAWNGKTDTVTTQDEVYDLVNPLRTQSVNFTVVDTVKTGGETVWAWKVPYNITITEIASFTNANTVTFNIEQRAQITPNTAGTDCMSADQVADNDQQETTSFADATVPADTWLVCVVTSAGDVSLFSVTIRFTID
jgi:hypothetical protein